MAKPELTPSQALLRGVYFERWRNRNDAANELNSLLFQVERARRRLDDKQSALESVATALRETGDPKDYFEDYFDRVWPLTKPEEQPTDYSRMAVMD